MACKERSQGVQLFKSVQAYLQPYWTCHIHGGPFQQLTFVGGEIYFFYNFLLLLSDQRNMFSGDKTTLVCQPNVFRTRKEVVRCQRPNEDLAQTSFPGKPAEISENLGKKN